MDRLSVYKLLRLRNIDSCNERKWFYTKKISRWYPAQIISNAEDTDDMTLLANTPTQAESLLHSLEQAAGGIDLHVNADKTKYMCFNKKEVISY